MDPQALRPVVSRSSLISDWFHAGNGWKKSQEDSSQAWWMIEASVLGLYPRASFIYNTDTFHWFQPSPQCLSVAGESRDRSVTDWVLNSWWTLDQLFTGSDGKMSKVVVSSVKDKPIVLIYRRKVKNLWGIMLILFMCEIIRCLSRSCPATEFELCLWLTRSGTEKAPQSFDMAWLEVSRYHGVNKTVNNNSFVDSYI